MRFAFSLCTALALSVPSMVFAAFAVPDLPPYQAAIKAIRRGYPGKAFVHYENITDKTKRHEVLQEFLGLNPLDYEKDELAELINVLEQWNHNHPHHKIGLSQQWRFELTKASPVLSLQYAKEAPTNVEKAPKKTTTSPVPAGMVKLYSLDDYPFNFPQAYARNPAISEWLANVFKDTSRTSIKVPHIIGSVLRYLASALKNIGELWDWALQSFSTKIEQEANIIKQLNDHINSDPDIKSFTDKFIFEMIKAADSIQAPIARRLYLQRLGDMNKSADQIKAGLKGYSHLWPEWVKKGK